MFRYLKIIYNYIKLFTYIGYIKYRKIDIKNNIEWINTIKDIVNNGGFMLIKSVQWLLPSYNILYPDTLLYEIFKSVYDDCYVHDIKLTQRLFWQECNQSIYDNFEIIDILGSGSIGQVYLIQNIQTQKQYALKVIHPHIYKEFVIFNIFIKILLYFVDYKKYIPVNDIDNFINGIKDQLNLLIECENNIKFCEMYEHTDKILIPEVYYCTEKLMIMEYIKGDNFDPELLGEYQSYKYLMLLIIFTNNSSLNGLTHGDIHSGNWKIKDGSLVIYDFGYCFTMESQEYDILNEFIARDKKLEINQKFFDYYLSKTYNSDIDKDFIDTQIIEIIDEYSNVIPPKLHRYINIVMNFCLKNDITISTTCLNGLLLFLQLIEIFNKVQILECQQTYESYLSDILNHTKANNMTPKLIEYIEKKIDENNSQSIMIDDFKRFEGLKKFI